MTTVRKALLCLLTVCDGAVSYDGAGFNGYDANFARSLAKWDKWTDKQEKAAYRMLRKYRRQLLDFDIVYDEIEFEKEGSESKIPTRKKRMYFSEVKGDRFIVVEFAYDRDLVTIVKGTPVRRWNQDKKRWELKDTPVTYVSPNFLELLKRGFEVDKEILEKLSSIKEVREQSEKVDDDIEVDIRGTLKPFQKAGVRYIIDKKRVLLADEMGLGKTIQAIASIHHINAYPCVVVCPASAKINWEREFNKWVPDKTTHIINGKKVYDLPKADAYIINYDILDAHKDVLKSKKVKAAVSDESHYIKSKRATRSKAVHALFKDVEVQLLLSGTPAKSRPSELISQLELLGVLNKFGGWKRYVYRYCGAHQTPWGLDISGSANLAELHTALRSECMVRRLKKDVFKELPEKSYQEVYFDIKNRNEYSKAESNVFGYLRQKFIEEGKRYSANFNAEALVKIEVLKQLALQGKMEGVCEWVENFLESGEKLVLFAHHRNIVEEISKRFNAPTIYGGISQDKKQEAIDRFQNDPDCNLIVCSITAAGVAITLTAAHNVAFAEFVWTPADHAQAEDRCHRIGQENNVTVWSLVAHRTIEENIIDMISSKREVVNAIHDGKIADGEAGNIFNGLVESILKEVE